MISKKIIQWLWLLALLSVCLGGCKDVKANEQTVIIGESTGSGDLTL